MKEIVSFGIKIHPLRKHDFLAIIDNGIKNKKQLIQSGINAASVVELKHLPSLEVAYNNCDLINIDGMSMVWALRFFGFRIPERVACPDLAEGLMELAEKNGYGIYLFGAKEEILLSALQNIKSNYPRIKISGYRNGYFSEDDEGSIVNMINQSKADILFLGLPSPLKEMFVEKHKHSINSYYILGVGGFFDILSGSITRAPLWMQNTGFEWFYRFIQEPKRLLIRYLIGNIKFIWLVISEKTHFKK